jgi:hypothetical protein
MQCSSIAPSAAWMWGGSVFNRWLWFMHCQDCFLWRIYRYKMPSPSRVLNHDTEIYVDCVFIKYAGSLCNMGYNGWAQWLFISWQWQTNLTLVIKHSFDELGRRYHLNRGPRPTEESARNVGIIWGGLSPQPTPSHRLIRGLADGHGPVATCSRTLSLKFWTGTRIRTNWQISVKKVYWRPGLAYQWNRASFNSSWYVQLSSL